MKVVAFLLTLLLLCRCGTHEDAQHHAAPTADRFPKTPTPPVDWTFHKVEGSQIRFRGGQSWETHLFDLEYLGQVAAVNKAPFLVFAGRYCGECDANLSLYIHSPSDGHPVVEHGQNRYAYPGTETDYETGRVVYSARAFFGEVLEDTYGVIWYESTLLENGKMGRSIFLSRIVNGVRKDTAYPDHGSLNRTVALKKKGRCTEIPGREYTSEP